VIQNPLPPLARSALDRDYLLRANPDLFTVLRSQLNSMALLMHKGKVLIDQDSALALVPFSSAPKSEVVVYLGKTLEESASSPTRSGICLVVLDKAQADAIESDASKWISLRASGAGLSALDAGIFTLSLIHI
jgi:NAD+ diphosphatase